MVQESVGAGGNETLTFDLVVLGGGMAGMTAAGYAASRGANVCVIEKGADIGGSAVLSAGIMWAASDFKGLREHAPRGDARLQRAFIQRFPATADWVRSTGIAMSSEHSIYGFGTGYAIDILNYIRRCEAMVRSAGGWVLRSTMTHQLLIERGNVCGVVVRSGDGALTPIRGGAVILATGGFQGDRSLLYQQFGENARQLLLRSNVYSTGDGLRLGMQAGADVAGEFSAFYGHLIPWPLSEFGPKDFRRLSVAQWSLMGLLVNLNGSRFTDESFAYHENAVEAAKQPHARTLLLLDAAGYQRGLGFEAALSWSAGFGAHAERPEARSTPAERDDTKLAEIRAAGARVTRDGTIDGLVRTVGNWGFETARTRDTICAYNAMLQGEDAHMPPRRCYRYPFGPGPYLAIETRPAITGTQGGLRVDEQSRVLDRAGHPIRGLLAAGTDAGDFYNGGYAGNLSVCCVFGLTAVETILGARLFRSDVAAAEVRGSVSS